MEATMGYTNSEAVYAIARAGGLLQRKGGENGGMRLNLLALQVLEYMAHVTYDWDTEHNRPSAKLVRLHKPCRYYALGWRNMAEGLGMVSLPPDRLIGMGAEEIAAALNARNRTACNRISGAWRFLREQGYIKRLNPPTVGHTTGYLLLLGDRAENAEVERWALKCLALEEEEEGR